jgi:WD40 repeat protein
VTHLEDEEVTQSWGTVLFSPDNSQLVHHGGEVLRIWDIASGLLLTRERLPGNQLAMNMAFSPDGKTLVVNNGFIYIINLENNELIARIRGDSAANSLAISADGSRLVTISNGKVFNYRLADGSLINGFETDSNSINVPVRPEVTEILSFSAESTGRANRYNRFRFYISTWDIDTETMLFKTETYDFELDDMVYFATSPSGKYLAWFGLSGEVKIWQIQN